MLVWDILYADISATRDILFPISRIIFRGATRRKDEKPQPMVALFPNDFRCINVPYLSACTRSPCTKTTGKSKQYAGYYAHAAQARPRIGEAGTMA